MRPSERVFVIGSGFGGLAAGIRLQTAGYRTEILEKNDGIGGRAAGFVQDGYRFDAGPTVVTAPGAIKELFEEAGRSMADYVDLLPVMPMYKLFWEDGETFSYHASEDALLRELARIDPKDAREYRRFFEYTLKVYDAGYVKLGHVPFLKFWDMARVSPALLRLRAYRSVYGVVSKFFKHPKIRQAFSFNSLLIGGHPFRASAIYTLIHPLERNFGVYYPKGGMSALVHGLADLYTELGGQIHTGMDVEKILTSQRQVVGVRVGDGASKPCRAVIHNGDVTHAYTKLLMDEDCAKTKARRLLRMRHSMSLFLVYFGTKKTYPGLNQHNVMFGNRYRELLDDIFDKGVLADDFSLYLHAPGITDKSACPDGKHSYYALVPVPNIGKFSGDWPALAESYADRIIGYLDDHYMPGLRGDILTRKTFTPADFRDKYHAHLGSAFSLEPLLTQSAYFRVRNRDPRIEGLYFVGAGTHPGAGIPGVIGSAKATAALVKDDLTSPLRRVRSSFEWGSAYARSR